MEDKKTDKEILAIWILMLDQIPEEKKQQAALLLDDMADYCLFVSRFRSLSLIEKFIYPIMLRIMSKKNIYVFDSKKLLNDVASKWAQAEHVFDYKRDAAVDIEAKFCSVYADKYEAEQYKVPPIMDLTLTPPELNIVPINPSNKFKPPGIYTREVDISSIKAEDLTGTTSLSGLTIKK